MDLAYLWFFIVGFLFVGYFVLVVLLVVLMPPLTSTADELDRVVDVLAACIDEVAAEDAR